MEPVALDSLSGIEVPDFYGTYFSKAKKFDAVADTNALSQSPTIPSPTPA